MDTGDLIAERVDSAIKKRKTTRKAVAKAAKISGGGLSDFLNRTIQAKNGKPSTMRVDSLEALCAQLRIPVWALIHEDGAVFDLFLEDVSLYEATTQDPARAIATVMALLSEARERAAKRPVEKRRRG